MLEKIIDSYRAWRVWKNRPSLLFDGGELIYDLSKYSLEVRRKIFKKYTEETINERDTKLLRKRLSLLGDIVIKWYYKGFETKACKESLEQVMQSISDELLKECLCVRTIQKLQNLVPYPEKYENVKRSLSTMVAESPALKTEYLLALRSLSEKAEFDLAMELASILDIDEAVRKELQEKKVRQDLTDFAEDIIKEKEWKLLNFNNEEAVKFIWSLDCIETDINAKKDYQRQYETQKSNLNPVDKAQELLKKEWPIGYDYWLLRKLALEVIGYDKVKAMVSAQQKKYHKRREENVNEFKSKIKGLCKQYPVLHRLKTLLEEIREGGAWPAFNSLEGYRHVSGASMQKDSAEEIISLYDPSVAHHPQNICKVEGDSNHVRLIMKERDHGGQYLYTETIFIRGEHERFKIQTEYTYSSNANLVQIG